MAFQTIFGSDAIRAAAYVAEAGSEGFAAMGESMAAAGPAVRLGLVPRAGPTNAPGLRPGLHYQQRSKPHGLS
jgi:hypothetical protein